MLLCVIRFGGTQPTLMSDVVQAMLLCAIAAVGLEGTQPTLLLVTAGLGGTQPTLHGAVGSGGTRPVLLKDKLDVTRGIWYDDVATTIEGAQSVLQYDTVAVCCRGTQPMLQCEVVVAFGSMQPLLQYGNTDGT